MSFATAHEIKQLLSQPLGEAKATEVVFAARQELGIVTDELTKQETVRLLEKIVEQPGLVGISASFLKSRMLLRN